MVTCCLPSPPRRRRYAGASAIVLALVLGVLGVTGDPAVENNVCRPASQSLFSQQQQVSRASRERTMESNAAVDEQFDSESDGKVARQTTVGFSFIAQYAHAIAGAGGGLATVLLLHPFDTLKTRMQSDTSSRRTGTFRTLREILVRDGMTGLYRGAVPAFTGSMVSWAMYMHCFHSSRDLIHTFLPNASAVSTDFASGTSAGLLTAFVTNPIWVVKVRLQLQQRATWGAKHTTGRAVQGVGGPLYTGFLHGLYCIARDEGLRGLYRGLGPSLWLVSHGAIQFTLYERFKSALLDLELRRQGAPERVSHGRGVNPSTVYSGVAKGISVRDSLLASTGSKLVASVATYPLQLVRTRMQELGAGGGRYGTFPSGFMRILSTEGVLGFYRGMIPNVMRVLPQSAVTFVTYEQILKFCRYTNETSSSGA